MFRAAWRRAASTFKFGRRKLSRCPAKHVGQIRTGVSRQALCGARSRQPNRRVTAMARNDVPGLSLSSRRCVAAFVHGVPKPHGRPRPTLDHPALLVILLAFAASLTVYNLAKAGRSRRPPPPSPRRQSCHPAVLLALRIGSAALVWHTLIGRVTSKMGSFIAEVARFPRRGFAHLCRDGAVVLLTFRCSAGRSRGCILRARRSFPPRSSACSLRSTRRCRRCRAYATCSLRSRLHARCSIVCRDLLPHPLATSSAGRRPCSSSATTSSSCTAQTST